MGRKTLLYLIVATIVAVTMSSCEKEHSDNQDGNGGASGKKLVKTTYFQYFEFDVPNRHTMGYAWESRFQWNGNRLVGFDDDDYDYVLTYQGDNLTEIRLSYDDYQQNINITYDGDHITEIYCTYTEGTSSVYRRHTMTYSDDGHLQEMTTTEDDGSFFRYLLTWTDSNVTSVQKYENGSLIRTSNYTYDDKKSPYAEMPEWHFYIDGSLEDLSANNVITEYRENSNTTYTYTYDGDYPVKRFVTWDNYTSTTYYEYADGTGSSQMPQVCTIESAANNDSWGQVYGEGEYASDSTVILYAEAYSGYTFQQWNDGNTENPRSFTANGNATYTAIFASNNGGGKDNKTTPSTKKMETPNKPKSVIRHGRVEKSGRESSKCLGMRSVF